MRYRCIIFDLDGTLLNSEEGVWRSFEYALRKLGAANPVIDDPKPIIGPPIEDVLMDTFGFDRPSALKGYDYYQEEYVDHGRMYRDPFFPGTPEALKTLKALGCVVGVCTNKGEPSARDIVAHGAIGIADEWVYGYAPEKGQGSKVAIINAFLKHVGLDSDQGRQGVLMVGDRYTDMEGARDAGIDGVAVAWGNGSRKELLDAGAMDVVESYDGLIAIVKGE